MSACLSGQIAWSIRVILSSYNGSPARLGRRHGDERERRRLLAERAAEGRGRALWTARSIPAASPDTTVKSSPMEFVRQTPRARDAVR